MAKISSQVVNDLKKQIDESIGPEGIPGTVYCAVNKNGDLIFEHAAGEAGLGKGIPMTMDTVFWIASCTKMITGIACMQLVEQGKLSLDDGDQVEKLAPVSRTVNAGVMELLPASLSETESAQDEARVLLHDSIYR